MSFVNERRVLASLLVAAATFTACDDAPPPPSAPAPAGQPIRSKPVGAPIANTPVAPAPSTLPAEVRALTGATLAAEAPPSKPPRFIDGYLEVKFELLTSYEYEWSQTTGESSGDAADRIPLEVRALDQAKDFIRGYMQPIDFDKNGVKSFLLTNMPGGCCFGMIPRLNEWADVTMPEGQYAEYSYYDQIELRGKLLVGEAKSGEVVTALYRMTPDSVTVVEEQLHGRAKLRAALRPLHRVKRTGRAARSDEPRVRWRPRRQESIDARTRITA